MTREIDPIFDTVKATWNIPLSNRKRLNAAVRDFKDIRASSEEIKLAHSKALAHRIKLEKKGENVAWDTVGSVIKNWNMFKPSAVEVIQSLFKQFCHDPKCGVNRFEPFTYVAWLRWKGEAKSFDSEFLLDAARSEHQRVMKENKYSDSFGGAVETALAVMKARNEQPATT